MKSLYIALTIGVGVVATVFADVLLKQGVFGDWRYLIAGWAMYGAVAVPVAYALRLTSFGGLFLAWEAATVVVGVAVATAFYHEPLTFARLSAVVLAVGAIALASAP